MRIGKYVLLLLLTFRFEAFCTQSGSGKSEVWQFMVRNAMKMEDIGVRFNTDIREVKKLSKVSGKIVMPGTVLFIPVKLRPVTWDPTNFNPNEVVLPKEVMRPKKDYELDFTVIDPEIINDFIIMDDMVKDSIQIEKMLKYVGRIDKTIKQLEYSLDSLKKAEFSFDYDENDKNSVIQKMEMARQRFYMQGPAGKEIDSLKALRGKLGQEINRMNARINDYDFLRENQYYFSKKKSPLTYAETQVIPQWGDQIKQETKYFESKNQPDVRKPEQEMAVAPPSVKPEPTAQAKPSSEAPPQEVKPIEHAPITESKPASQPINSNSEDKGKEKVDDVVNQNISDSNQNADPTSVAVLEKTTGNDALIGDQQEEESDEVRDDDLAELYNELDSMEATSDYSPKYFGEVAPAQPSQTKTQTIQTQQPSQSKPTASAIKSTETKVEQKSQSTQPQVNGAQKSVSPESIKSNNSTVASSQQSAGKESNQNVVSTTTTTTNTADKAAQNKADVSVSSKVPEVDDVKVNVNVVPTSKTKNETVVQSQSEQKVVVPDIGKTSDSKPAAQTQVSTSQKENTQDVAQTKRVVEVTQKETQTSQSQSANVSVTETGQSRKSSSDNNAATEQSKNSVAKESNDKEDLNPSAKVSVTDDENSMESEIDIKYIEFEETANSETKENFAASKNQKTKNTNEVIVSDANEKISEDEKLNSKSAAQKAKSNSTATTQKSTPSESDESARLSSKQPKQESKAISTLAEENKEVAIYEESSSIDVSDVKVKDKVVKKVVTVDEIFDKGIVNLTPSDVSLARITQTKETPRYLTPSDSVSVQRATESFKRFEDLMRSKEYKKALQMLERALEYDPNNCDYWSYHADFLISAGKELDAMRELNIAIKINPDNPKQLFKIAKLYDRTNNFDRAFEYYTYTIMSDYTFEDAYYERADLALRQNDRKSAIADYDKLLQVNKNASRAYLERGTLRMAERNFEGAVEDFNAYFDIEDPQGETMYKRGIAKIFMGKIIDGCEDFKISFDLGFADADKAIKKYCQ